MQKHYSTFTIKDIDSQYLLGFAEFLMKNYLNFMYKLRFNKKNIAILLGLSFSAILGIMIGVFVALTHDLPQIRSLETFRPSSVTRIYSADKVLLAELFLEKRDPVPLNVIPDYLKKALIATEDRKFYQHSGIDLRAVLRAIIRDIRAGEFVEGASTITQQLAKTLFLTPRKTLLRKIREAFLAFQLERRYTKDEILELYLNQVYFGSGAYGVESAARIFFGKPAKDLGLAECALVAGMPKLPSRYSPLINKDLSIKRRNTVLKQMKETEIITETEFNKATEDRSTLENKTNIQSKRPTLSNMSKTFSKTLWVHQYYIKVDLPFLLPSTSVCKKQQNMRLPKVFPSLNTE